MSFEPEVPRPELVIQQVMADSANFKGAETILSALSEAGYQLFVPDRCETTLRSSDGRIFYLVPRGKHERERACHVQGVAGRLDCRG